MTLLEIRQLVWVINLCWCTVKRNYSLTTSNVSATHTHRPKWQGSVSQR